MYVVAQDNVKEDNFASLHRDTNGVRTCTPLLEKLMEVVERIDSDLVWSKR
jgi:hypothetical protein